MTKVTASGHLVWSSYLGGSDADQGRGIAVDPYGDIFLTGPTWSADLPERYQGFDCCYNGKGDAFVAKIIEDKEIGFGKLYGTVWDPNGSLITDANVTVPGQMTHTDASGQFSFDSNDGDPLTRDIFASQATVTVTKTDPNYYPVTKIVTIDVNSTTRVNITMAKELQFPVQFTDPCVVDVRAKYCGPGTQDPYYMYGPSLCEKFVATIDWGDCDPVEVKWTTRGEGDYTDILSSSTLGSIVGGRKVTNHGRCFDMGSDDFGVGNGWVKVVACGNKPGVGEVYSSAKKVDFFDVTAPPGYVTDANDTGQVAVVFTGNGFEYKIVKVPDFNLAPWDGSEVGGDIPIFGGENMNVGLAQDEPSPHGSKLSAAVNADGMSFVFTQGYDGTTKKEVHREVPIKGIELPELPGGVKVEASATADFFFTWVTITPPGEWSAGGTLDLGCTFSFSSPEFPGPPVFGIPTYTRADLSLDLGLSSTLTQTGWDADGPQLESNFYFEPLAKGILGAGVADVACVEGYVGGGFHSEILLVPNVEWGDTYVILVGGVEVTIGPWSKEAGLEYDWWLNPGVHKTQAINLYQLLRSNDFTPLPRDYLYQEGPLVLGDNEDVIASIVFPSCVPELVRIGGDIMDSNMLAVWIDDDIDREPNDRTELRYATYDGNDWTTPADVNDDGTADLNPQLISLRDGNAVCIWQDANTVFGSNDIDLQTFNSHLEIAVWRYNSSKKQWINMAFPNKWLTTNNYLDRSPKLAAANENDMLAVWIRNEDCNTWGDVGTAPNKIMWSKYYYGVWDGPYAMASDLGPILGTALAYDGSTATYVFCVDSNDDDPNINPQYQELYMATYSSSTGWSGPDRLTDDSTQPVTDAAPRLAYDTNGNLLLFWVKGDSIRTAKGTGGTIEPDDVTYAQAVVMPGQSWGSKDFDLVMGDIGQIALVWSDVSVPNYPERLDPNHFDPNRIEPNYVDPDRDLYRIPTPNEPNRIRVGYDIWVCYRDPCFGLWSLPRQLTWDDAAERLISGAFDPDGTLLCVYNKRQTVYEIYDYDPCDTEPNHHIIHVRNVPNAGRSDLVYLRDGLKSDLSIELEDVMVSPPNPMPGTTARITAKVKNLGVSPDSGTINFFNGADGNELILSVLIVGGAAGDFDRNGYVDFGDLDLLAGYWLSEHCSIWNNCERTDISKNGRVEFRDFALFAKDWHTLPIPGPVVGGDEAEISVDWPVPPENNYPRMIRVVVDPCNVQDDPNWNNAVSFNVLAPDLTIGEMDVHTAGPNSIITVRVANRGVLPAYDMNNQIKVVLTDPDGLSLREKDIQGIAPMTYYDVSFTLSSVPAAKMIYAIVDPSNAIDEFNEDNNTRSIRIR